MRASSLVAVVVAVAAIRTFSACTHEAGPGEDCQGNVLSDYTCPPGYSCNDAKGWTCQPQSGPPGYMASSPPPARFPYDADTDADADPVPEDAGGD